MKKARSYVLGSAIAGGVMYYAVKLSSSGRTLIDWIVIGLVAAAILWNLVRLGQRLFRSGGAWGLWHQQRTLVFWIVGLLNTAYIPLEDVGSWRHWLGWAFLILALADTAALYKKEQLAAAGAGAGGEG